MQAQPSAGLGLRNELDLTELSAHEVPADRQFVLGILQAAQLTGEVQMDGLLCDVLFATTLLLGSLPEQSVIVLIET